jgi:2-polyprenyl-3-methyl-5-hydroxy-6-metoxy-1,4-benzoquinol methylase
MNCLICNKQEKLNLIDDYKLDVKDDYKYFKDIKIYQCSECDFSFVDPVPSINVLDYFYENIYRSLNRPPYWLTGNYNDLKKSYLEDRNLSYLLYLTTLVDILQVKNVYDFGAGYGDLGFSLKKKFPNLNLFCTENDKFCKKILNERNYTNFEKAEDINQKFDLIISLHTLEHMTDLRIFSKFYDILNPNGHIFFEVPNCSKEYFDGRPYDSPHLLFYTKKSLEKIALKFNFKFINISFSSYSFKDDHKFQRESQNLYNKRYGNKYSYLNFKNILRKITPKYLIQLRQEYLKIKKNENEDKINWFTNNTGDNCYIRAILTKKN